MPHKYPKHLQIHYIEMCCTKCLQFYFVLFYYDLFYLIFKIYLQKLNYEATSIFDLLPYRIYAGLVSLLCKLPTRTRYSVWCVWHHWCSSKINKSSAAFLVDTSVCKIPRVDPFDKSVKHVLKNGSALECETKVDIVICWWKYYLYWLEGY